MAITAEDVQRVTREHLPEEKAAALIYRPESAPVVAVDAADMKRILGEGGSERLPTIPARTAKPQSGKQSAQFEKQEAGVSVFRTAEGVPVLVRRKPGPIANIGVYVLGGAIEEEVERADRDPLARREDAERNDDAERGADRRGFRDARRDDFRQRRRRQLRLVIFGNHPTFARSARAAGRSRATTDDSRRRVRDGTGGSPVERGNAAGRHVSLPDAPGELGRVSQASIRRSPDGNGGIAPRAYRGAGRASGTSRGFSNLQW